MIIVSVLTFSMMACCGSSNSNISPSENTPVTVTPTVTQPPVKRKTEAEIFVEKLMATKTIEDSLALTKPKMGSSHEIDEMSIGHNLFGAWSMQNANRLSWKDFNSITNETNSGLIRKNPEKESGKKICVSARIVQIKEVNDNLSEGLFISSGDIYAFAGIKSSGDLTEDSVSKFCGIVTGTYDYVGHAISMVGMWSVPGNLKLP